MSGCIGFHSLLLACYYFFFLELFLLFVQSVWLVVWVFHWLNSVIFRVFVNFVIYFEVLEPLLVLSCVSSPAMFSLGFCGWKGNILYCVILEQNCKNLVDRCTRETFAGLLLIIDAALTWEQVWHPWVLDGGAGAIKPVLLPYFMAMSFFHLHVPSVGRDTELDFDVSLNFECSGSSGHWVWSENCLT